MTNLAVSLIAAITVAAPVFLYSRRRKQLGYIQRYAFHPAIARKVKEKYPHLEEQQLALVFEALREYFFLCHRAGRRMVAMPSQVVDVAWHEFILFTRPYQLFCRNALGRFLHHTPTEAMHTPTLAREGIRRTWRLACARSGIDPATPAALPLLFAIDAELDIEDGFRYVLDCEDQSSPLYGSGYCAGHIGCASGCSGSCGDPDAGGDGGCSSGCGGGCGGD